MSTIEFESAKFAPFLPESCQANPGAYGFELATWLSQALMKRGVVTSYPIGEDWGWFIEYIEGDTELMIGCSSTASEGDGASGAPIAWMIAVSGRKRLRKQKGDRSAATESIVQHIVAALAAEGITASVAEE